MPQGYKRTRRLHQRATRGGYRRSAPSTGSWIRSGGRLIRNVYAAYQNNPAVRNAVNSYFSPAAITPSGRRSSVGSATPLPYRTPTGQQVNYNSRSNRLPQRFGRSVGVYKGKFKKAKKLGLDDLKTTCQKKGYHLMSEIHGVVQDPHCVYLGHGTMHVEFYARAIQAAWIRKAMSLAKIAPMSKDVRLEFVGTGGTPLNEVKFLYYVINPTTGVTTTYPYTCPAGNMQFDALIGSEVAPLNAFQDMYEHIRDYLLNVDDALPYKLILQVLDNDSAGMDEFYKTQVNIPLLSEKLTIYAKSTLAIQNRTAGDLASSGDLSSDRVDSQPLKGIKYNFKHGEPRLRNVVDITINTNYSDAVLNNTYQYGFRSIRSGQLTTGDDYWEPPNPKIFSNVSSTGKVILNPGDIKKDTIMKKWSGTAQSLLRKLRVQGSSGGEFVTGVPGLYQLFCLEEVIRTAGTNPITTNYEREIEVGCYSVSGKNKPVWLSQFESATVNNVPS